MTKEAQFVTGLPHVLFVDDEPRILDGLRRMMRMHRRRWDMSFAGGAAEALAILRSRPCDVIITDYRMPGMDGAQLLDQVRSGYPGTARVILSGQTNEDNLLKIMVLAHEFLTKPTTPEQLVFTIERLLGVRMTAAGSRWPGVGLSESLPSAPNTLLELTEALDAENASAQSVGSVIERDPAATAKVLQLVNSSAYTAGRTVSNVAQAVALLGLHAVRGLVLMHDLIRTFDADGLLPADWIEELTVHSIETSRLARVLSADATWQSHAFTAGLLHETGQLVLASSRPADFHGVLASWQGSDVPLSDCETETFDVSHVEVGASLLALWGLPAAVIEAVAAHTVVPPPTAPTDPSSAVALAHLIVEAELGPVCGPYGSTPFDESALDEPAREAVSRWRSARPRQASPAPPAP
jgi:HD-like signal output (HDOD) protein/ActR/RegA family two-component response regulator